MVVVSRKPKRAALGVVVLVLLPVLGASLDAGNTASQTVTFEVRAVNEVSVSGNPDQLEILTATAGSQPDAAVDATTTYSLTTNGRNRKLTAVLDSGLPPNVNLRVALAPMAGATSPGTVELSSVAAADVLTGITSARGTGLGVRYTLTADAAAGKMAPSIRVVKLTLH
ncbi:MAG: hypothetical protein HY815_03965 [Candidatus Riflebacteria bacterium]|nr:hypothetical protein [Candidatus Riflebacteria bacterium]